MHCLNLSSIWGAESLFEPAVRETPPPRLSPYGRMTARTPSVACRWRYCQKLWMTRARAHVSLVPATYRVPTRKKIRHMQQNTTTDTTLAMDSVNPVWPQTHPLPSVELRWACEGARTASLSCFRARWDSESSHDSADMAIPAGRAGRLDESAATRRDRVPPRRKPGPS